MQCRLGKEKPRRERGSRCPEDALWARVHPIQLATTTARRDRAWLMGPPGRHPTDADQAPTNPRPWQGRRARTEVQGQRSPVRAGPSPRQFSDAMETSDTWKNCQPREITAPWKSSAQGSSSAGNISSWHCARRGVAPRSSPQAQYRRRFPPAVLADKNGVHFHVAHSLDHNELLADRITFSRGRQHDAGVTACNHADTARPTSGRPAELV